MNTCRPECDWNRIEETGDLLRRSRLFREYQAEREEILRHKWFESQRAGHDIGFESALMSWVLRHRAPWRRAPSSRVDS